MDGGVFLVGQADEDIKGVHEKAVCFAPGLLADGCDDVHREFMIRSVASAGGMREGYLSVTLLWLYFVMVSMAEGLTTRT